MKDVDSVPAVPRTPQASSSSSATARTLSAVSPGLASRETQRMSKIVEERNRRLASIKDKIESCDSGDSTRLQTLLKQIEMYSSFMTARPTAESTTSGQTPGNRRSRMKEKEEDDTILQDEEAEEEFAPVRLTSSPFFVTGGTMRSYQVHGLNWLIKLYDLGINGILADEMGLGKTLQTISLLGYLKHMRGISGPHLVIAPKSTLMNWIKEVKRWCPSLRPMKLQGSKEEREVQKKQLFSGEWDVCVTSYEAAIMEKSSFIKIPWYYLIIDEAHRIKNEKSKLSTIIRLFKTQCRLLLTGTPLQNNLHELWALLNYLLPEIFSSSDDFDEWFDITSGDQDDIIKKLHKILRPFLLRRLKSEVEKDLPPKKETKLYIGLSQMQKDWYKNILRKDFSGINVSEDGSKSKNNRVRLLNIVMQLRKCCNHPYLFQGAEPGPPYTTGEHLVTNSGKMVLLDKLLKKLKEQGSRVLIFSQMTRLLDILEDYMLYRGHEYCRIDGSTNGDIRDEHIEAYNAPNSSKFVFLLSTRAGGLGINLATADVVIIYDSDWNPQMDLQAQDRAHRIGQKKPVRVFRFVTENTVEEKVVERAEAKLQLDALVIQQGRLVEQNKALNSNELLSMVRFGADQIISATGGLVTDEDIDKILERGEQKTEEVNEKIRQKVEEMSGGKSLQPFSLDTTEETNPKSVFEFEGVNYQEEAKDLRNLILDSWQDGPRQRVQRITYNIDEYYRDVLKPEGKPKKGPLPRPPKQPVIHDFQFFPDKVHELLEKETVAYRKKLEARRTGKFDEEEDFGELTDAEERLKDKLLEQGFSNWSRREFNQFVKACERHGRKDTATIAAEIETKTEKEVKSYLQAFKQNHQRINGWERLIERIEKGEEKLARIEEMQNALADKVARYKDPFKQLKIVYGQGKGKSYTTEEDVFLCCMTHQLGYGQWEELKAEIRKSWQFRFDWYLKSRTPQELNRRVDILIRLIEKENEELQEKEKQAKRKKAQGKKKQAESPASKKRKAPAAQNGGAAKKRRR